MSQINVSYSPYRSEFRAARLSAQKPAAAVAQVSDEVLKIDINPTVLIVVLFLLSLLLAALYLLNFNRVATKGYQLKRLEISQQELKDESDLKTLYLAKVKSMNGILNDSLLNGMHKPGQVEFVYGENVLAKAN
jgi:hypothetical protein